MNVFLVTSPLQLLNSIEAREHFYLKKEECILIILCINAKYNVPQLKNMILEEYWFNVHYIVEVGKMAYYRAFKKINSLISKLQYVDLIFIGDYRFDLMRHFSNKLNHQDIYLLDDGNGTLLLHENFKSKTFKNKIKAIIKKLIGVNSTPIQNLNLFTIYDISGNFPIKRNIYSYLKSYLKDVTVLDEIYFIGTPLSELHIIPEGYYLAYLKKIINYFSPKKMIYIPHRRESIKKIERINKEYGIQIKYLDTCIEYELTIRNQGVIPKAISSFTSAALINCKVIFDDNIEVISFCLPEDKLSESERHETKEIYSFLSKYISVIDLGDIK